MKKLLCIISFVCMATLQMVANNDSYSQSLGIMGSEKSVILDLSGLVEEARLFTITDQMGEIVFSESVDKYENRVKYDLSKLPVGRYNIQVEGENFVELHTTLITKELVSFERVESYFRPTFKEENGKIVVEATSSNMENISMTIYNMEGELVYEFSDQRIGKFQKTFDLTQLEKGTYSVIVSSDRFSRTDTVSL